MDRDLLGHAVRGAADRAGDVRAVAVAVVRALPSPMKSAPLPILPLNSW